MLKKLFAPSLAELVQEAIRAELGKTFVSLPGQVTSYDINTQKAQILPIMKIKYENIENPVTLPVVNSVPVKWDSANNGDAYIHLPLKSGDLGMLTFCDRSIDSYLLVTEDIEGQITPLFHDKKRQHSLNDAWFTPGILPFSKALQDTSSVDLIIKNGDLRIEIDPDGKIAILNSEKENDLISLMIELFEFIRDAKVLTAIGAQGFLAVDVLKMQQNIDLLKTFKK